MDCSSFFSSFFFSNLSVFSVVSVSRPLGSAPCQALFPSFLPLHPASSLRPGAPRSDHFHQFSPAPFHRDVKYHLHLPFSLVAPVIRPIFLSFLTPPAAAKSVPLQFRHVSFFLRLFSSRSFRGRQSSAKPPHPSEQASTEAREGLRDGDGLVRDGGLEHLEREERSARREDQKLKYILRLGNPQPLIGRVAN